MMLLSAAFVFEQILRKKLLTSNCKKTDSPLAIINPLWGDLGKVCSLGLFQRVKKTTMASRLCLLQLLVMQLFAANVAVAAPSAVVPAKEPVMYPVRFVEDGEFSRFLHLPVYEWSPTDVEPIGMVLAIHGLTLHGTSYDIAGKAFAAGGYYFVASDMRGFGKCARISSDSHEYCVDGDCKWKVDYEKSYNDIVNLAKLMKAKYPKLPMMVIGESLGCTLALRVAGEHPELVASVILSAPAVRLHPLMFYSPSSLMSGSSAILLSPKFRVNLRGFITNLVSNDSKISQGMLDDPLNLKELPLCDLLKTQAYVHNTVKYARRVRKEIPVLYLQGSRDRCVVPDSVVKLSKNTHSRDQTLKWLDGTGHLLLETKYLKAVTLAAVNDWVEDHQPAHELELKAIEAQIKELGGVVSE